MRIRTVAIYSQQDRQALHRFKADESYLVGEGQKPLAAYLDGDDILRIAAMAGADAIHPGYGFLSENPEFAQACEDAGLIFVGPPSRVLSQTGDKLSSRQIALAAKVPLTPGSPGPLTDPNAARKEAKRVGFPVVVKAAAAGGGRGIFRADDEAALEEALAAASASPSPPSEGTRSSSKNSWRTCTTLRPRSWATAAAVWPAWAPGSAASSAAARS
jgi:pyruvate carboxylase